jgi:hypothetical protein
MVVLHSVCYEPVDICISCRRRPPPPNLLWHRAIPVGTPKNLILSQHCHEFYCVTRLRHKNSYYNSPSYSVLPLPPSKHLWIALTPSSDIIIINNPLNTRHHKTKTSIIKSTITYIQSIYTHNLQLHTLQ